MQEQSDINRSCLRDQQGALVIDSLALGLLTAGTNLGPKHWSPVEEFKIALSLKTVK